jgi:hypothetical protein
MRKVSLSFAVLAAVLVAAVALAENTKIVVSFVSQAGSGVTGDVTLMSQPNGGTLVQGRVQGLEPNESYVSQYFGDGGCASSPGTRVAGFKSNPMGKAVFTTHLGASIGSMKSISIQKESDMSLKACAPVSP